MGLPNQIYKHYQKKIRMLYSLISMYYSPHYGVSHTLYERKKKKRKERKDMKRKDEKEN
jgi:hypothetical protein